MSSARGEPVARSGPEGQEGHRLDPRGPYRIVISGSSSQSAVGGVLLSGSFESRFEVLLPRGDSPGESGELVGEGDGGFVVHGSYLPDVRAVSRAGIAATPCTYDSILKPKPKWRSSLLDRSAPEGPPAIEEYLEAALPSRVEGG
jgi:hypothetical protein